MKPTNTISQTAFAIIFSINLVPTLINAKILFRENFEKSGSRLEGWTVTKSSAASVKRCTEDEENTYASQAHGDKSLIIYDPDNSSAATVYKIFNNSSTEYMVEFYIWLYSNRGAMIDSFPLCVFENISSNKKTDIALILDAFGTNGHSFAIYIKDSVETHDIVAFIDSTNRWYKIQIHRHKNENNNAVVDFYLDGAFINTYYPMNSNYVSNKISLGATKADSLSSGEMYYDDIIISTPPNGEHPRLLFKGNTEINKLRERKKYTYPTILGKSFKQMADSLRSQAEYWVKNPDVSQTHGDETVWCYYPYAQPAPHNLEYHFWTAISKAILLRLETWAFIHFLYPDDTFGNSCAAKAESALVSLSSNWQQWTDHQITYTKATKYSSLDTGYLLYALALTYDMIFNELDNYQKMTIENSLYSLGLGQLYLNATLSDRGYDPYIWPNGYACQNSALGLGSIVVSPIDSAVVDLVIERAHTFFDYSIVCDTMGGYVEGMVYGSFAINEFISFFEAYNNNPTDPTKDPYVDYSTYLKEFPYFRLYSLIPGGTKEVNFCDSWRDKEWNAFDEIIRLAAEYHDEHIQWYLSKKGEKKPSGSSFGFWTTFAPFLWLDSSLDTVAPYTLPQGRYFPGIEWVVFRTGWEDDDFLLALKSGHGRTTQSSCYNHGHYDQNHFIFGKEGKWLIGDWGRGEKNADWHNVVTLDNNITQEIDCTGRVESYFVCDDYGYTKLDATDCYDNLEQYLREVVFFLGPSPFVAIFDRIICDTSHTLNWWLHTYGTVAHNGSDYIWIDDDGTYLDVSIMLPESTEIDTMSYQDQDYGVAYRFMNVAKEEMREAEYLVLLLPHEATSPSAEKIIGKGLIGAKAHNTLVMFSDTLNVNYGPLNGGSYEVLVTDSLLNVVCNLVPDTNYFIITSKDTLPGNADTLQTNKAGILSFDINGTGQWKILITRSGR